MGADRLFFLLVAGIRWSEKGPLHDRIRPAFFMSSFRSQGFDPPGFSWTEPVLSDAPEISIPVWLFGEKNASISCRFVHISLLFYSRDESESNPGNADQNMMVFRLRLAFSSGLRELGGGRRTSVGHLSGVVRESAKKIGRHFLGGGAAFMHLSNPRLRSRHAVHKKVVIK